MTLNQGKYRQGVVIIEGHIQGLSNTRSFGEAGVPVIVVDTGECIARHSRYCKGFYRCPAYGSDELVFFLIHLAKVKGLKGWLLMPSNDHAVYTISHHKKRIEKYFKIITPELEIIDNIYNKAKLLDTAVSIGIPVPKTYYAQDLNMKGFSLSFPVLTRGCFGLDFYKALGCKVFVANDLEELRGQFFFIQKSFSVSKTLTQEVIQDVGTNKTISYCAFCVGGDIKAFWMGEKLREHPFRFGTATFARSVFIKECHDQSRPLLKTLHYTGVCEVEYIRDPNDRDYKLIEINPRTWLWVGLARGCGVDFARMAYEFVNGMNSNYPKEYETGVCWINPFTDTAYALMSMIKGRLGLKEYIRTMSNEKIMSALFAKGDLKPGFVYLYNTFSYLRER
jgi:D-aspartate ligase